MDRREDGRLLVRIEPCRGLVDEEKPGGTDERRREEGPPLHPAGENFQPSVHGVVEVKPLHDFSAYGLRLGAAAVDEGEPGQVFAKGELTRKVVFLGNVADPLPDRERIPARIDAVDGKAPLPRREVPVDCLEQGALTGAAGAKDDDRLGGLERDAPQSPRRSLTVAK